MADTPSASAATLPSRLSTRDTADGHMKKKKTVSLNLVLGVNGEDVKSIKNRKE